jgi:hypothetical protein
MKQTAHTLHLLDSETMMLNTETQKFADIPKNLRRNRWSVLVCRIVIRVLRGLFNPIFGWAATREDFNHLVHILLIENLQKRAFLNLWLKPPNNPIQEISNYFSNSLFSFAENNLSQSESHWKQEGTSQVQNSQPSILYLISKDGYNLIMTDPNEQRSIAKYIPGQVETKITRDDTKTVTKKTWRDQRQLLNTYCIHSIRVQKHPHDF